MEVSAKECVEGKELAEDVGKEDDFAEEVENHEVVAEAPTTTYTAGAG